MTMLYLHSSSTSYLQGANNGNRIASLEIDSDKNKSQEKTYKLLVQKQVNDNFSFEQKEREITATQLQGLGISTKKLVDNQDVTNLVIAKLLKKNTLSSKFKRAVVDRIINKIFDKILLKYLKFIFLPKNLRKIFGEDKLKALYWEAPSKFKAFKTIRHLNSQMKQLDSDSVLTSLPNSYKLTASVNPEKGTIEIKFADPINLTLEGKIPVDEED